MKLSLAAACAAALLIAWPRCTVAEESGLTLEQALARAREHAPAIAAAKGRIDEARGRLVGASVLFRDNPEIEGSAGARMTDHGELLEGSFGVRQLFELGGRRRARIAGASAAIERESADTADVTRRVLRDTATAFWDALHAAERQHLAEIALGVTEETERIARRRYQAGDVGPLDANIASAATARARSEVLAEKARYEAAVGSLRVALGMNAGEPLAIRGNLRPRPRYTMAELLARVSARPDLQALDAGTREAAADVRLGRALRWPNVGLGATYERDDGNNLALGLVTVTLPIFDRGQGLTAESMARERRLEFELDATRRAVEVEVQSAFEVYARRAAAVDELERGALPAVEENEGLARRSYEAGQLSLAELLSIRREILDTRVEYLDRLHEAAVAAVELEASAGVLQ
jgi:cobalt-zinc-cadmium efflux system outer membrane protein